MTYTKEKKQYPHTLSFLFILETKRYEMFETTKKKLRFAYSTCKKHLTRKNSMLRIEKRRILFNYSSNQLRIVTDRRILFWREWFIKYQSENGSTSALTDVYTNKLLAAWFISCGYRRISCHYLSISTKRQRERERYHILLSFSASGQEYLAFSISVFFTILLNDGSVSSMSISAFEEHALTWSIYHWFALLSHHLSC